MEKIWSKLQKERPVGTKENNLVSEFLGEHLKGLGYEVKSIPFECKVWEKGFSKIEVSGNSFEIAPSPYSVGVNTSAQLVFVSTMEELKEVEAKDKVLIVSGELTKEALQPKDFPFYYPDEHKALIALFEEKAPMAIIAATGQDFLSGLNPFPLFDDGNFFIPSAYIDEAKLQQIKEAVGENQKVMVVIDSQNKMAQSEQVIATKQGKEGSKKVLCCAHMDTKYDAPGALDNGTGVLMLMELAKRLKDEDYTVEIVPFNGEEYYGASGELAYLEEIKANNAFPGLVINLDSPCHIGGKNAVSFYNCDSFKETAVSAMNEVSEVVEGEQWYAGDHASFAFMGVPTIAVICSDLFEGGLACTHTPKDIADTVDINLIPPTVEYIKKFIKIANQN